MTEIPEPVLYLTSGALHRLTDPADWPESRPVFIRIGEGRPRLARYASQVDRAEMDGRTVPVLLIADGLGDDRHPHPG